MSEQEPDVLLGGLLFKGLVPQSQLCLMMEGLIDMNRSDVVGYCLTCQRHLNTYPNEQLGQHPVEVIVGGRPGKHPYEVCLPLIWLAKHGGKLE
ncbi:MAG: hypothetical protein Q7S31_00305 [bacterium]|nr:hypothetical protein [bacterium]